MVWPMEPGIVRRFARGLDEILVLDEKRAFIELFLRDILYGRAGAPPGGWARTDELGRRLVPADGELTADRIAAVVANRLRSGVLGGELGALPVAVEARVALIEAAGQGGRRRGGPIAVLVQRLPPQTAPPRCLTASFAGGGGGLSRHGPVDRRPGRCRPSDGRRGRHLDRPGAPFTGRAHMFQNVGDGTFFHSASLAVRAAVAAGVDITYKILYNGAVAMTGGQDVAGANRRARADPGRWPLRGVARIIVCSDDPGRHTTGAQLGRRHRGLEPRPARRGAGCCCGTRPG